jgi:surface polysaccharide O-acyltransferase-like enzyme
MCWLNFTKYPPSADFLLLTLGVGALLLAALEKAPVRLVGALAVLGGAPLFFYLIHLYGLHLLQLLAKAALGPNQGEAWALPGVGAIWLLAALAAIPCWLACRRFGPVKRASPWRWMRYL